jgi:hypothetical protein
VISSQIEMMTTCSVERLVFLRLLIWSVVLFTQVRAAKDDVSKLGFSLNLPRSSAVSSCQYAWQAQIDGATGLASSREVSRRIKLSNIGESRHSGNESQGDSHENIVASTGLQSCDDQEDFFRNVTDFFKSYPQWVGTGKITLGLFRSVPAPQVPRNHRRFTGANVTVDLLPNTNCILRDNLLGLNWFCFGQARSQRSSFFTRSGNGAYVDTTEVTVSIPVLGGLLARPRFQSDKLDPKLEFTLVHRQHYKGPRSLSSAVSHQASLTALERDVSIVTSLIDFAPALAGRPPVPRWRRWSYLATQSVAHAHVMWRFHRQCRRSLTADVTCPELTKPLTTNTKG